MLSNDVASSSSFREIICTAEVNQSLKSVLPPLRASIFDTYSESVNRYDPKEGVRSELCTESTVPDNGNLDFRTSPVSGHGFTVNLAQQYFLLLQGHKLVDSLRWCVMLLSLLYCKTRILYLILHIYTPLAPCPIDSLIGDWTRCKR
jgi:hypothetical protein